MMEVVVTTGATLHAKFQSNQHPVFTGLGINEKKGFWISLKFCNAFCLTFCLILFFTGRLTGYFLMYT